MPCHGFLLQISGKLPSGEEGETLPLLEESKYLGILRLYSGEPQCRAVHPNRKEPAEVIWASYKDFPLGWLLLELYQDEDPGTDPDLLKRLYVPVSWGFGDALASSGICGWGQSSLA